MLRVGTQELVVVMLVVALLFGPKYLPRMVRAVKKMVSFFRHSDAEV